LNNNLSTYKFFLKVILIFITNYCFAIDFQIFDNEGCGQLATSFKIIEPSPAQIQSCTWTFGNGNTSTECNTIVGANYTSPGTYNVNLRITLLNGSIQTLTKQVFVYKKPSPNFVVDQNFGCIPNATIKFDDKITLGEPGANIVSWFWDFGDGRTSTNANPTYTYQTIGEYKCFVICTRLKWL
jgi:hypothetical protein